MASTPDRPWTVAITNIIARDPYPVLVESIFDDFCENKRLAMTNQKVSQSIA